MKRVDVAGALAVMAQHSGACYMFVGHSRGGFEEWAAVKVGAESGWVLCACGCVCVCARVCVTVCDRV